MQLDNPVLIVALTLGGVLFINYLIINFIRKGGKIDFGYYRLLGRTLKQAGRPLKQQEEELAELNRLVRQLPNSDKTPPSDASTSD